MMKAGGVRRRFVDWQQSIDTFGVYSVLGEIWSAKCQDGRCIANVSVVSFHQEVVTFVHGQVFESKAAVGLCYGRARK